MTTTPNLDSNGVEISKNLKILINKNERVKVSSIEFNGNEQL
jgi:outer membrane protein insertion porin family